jgi:hypothetical protein
MNLHGGTEEYQVKLQYNGLSVVQSVIWQVTQKQL